MKDESSTAKRRRAPILIVVGFLLAFAATVLTVVLTGLFVRAPGTEGHDDAEPAVRAERAAPAQ